MAQDFQIIRPEDLMLVMKTAVQSTQDASCTHGHPAVLLVLFGTYRSRPGHEQRVPVLMPRCALAEVVGSLQAQIHREDGEQALQHFRDAIAAAAEESAAAFEQLHQQQRDCCEAGFRTGGAEHTCGRNTTGADRE